MLTNFPNGISSFGMPIYGSGNLPPVGNIYWVKKTTDADYDEFYADRYTILSNGKPNIYNTITAGIAALGNYDTLLITPGNYDEAGTVTLTGKKGVKIFGYNSGMQWGEGSTCWRDVTSTLDLLNLTGNHSVEIAGINFVVITDGKDAINFTGLNYSTHIHHCTFTGDVGGGAVMAYAINAGGSNSADLYVHDCKFFNQKTTSIINIGQRAVIKDNFFVVVAAGIGISGCDAAAGYNLIADNYFLGTASTGIGINRESYTSGNLMIVNNRFLNFSAGKDINQVANSDPSVVSNKADGANGAEADIDPTA